MLSKSQARAFFLVGTGLCGVVFIGLTVDTFRRIPTQTHADEITPEVKQGKDLWESSNCMGCHTLFGEGAYYAPELTKVYDRRGEAFIRAMLKDPEAMYPGARKMKNYGFSDSEITSLVAFLRWAGRVDLNGFPAAPPHAPKPPPAAAAAVASASAGAAPPPAVFGQICVACHALGGRGGQVGPALDGVGARLDADYLRRWIANPPAVKPDTKMPKLPLSEGQLDELVAFLVQQKGGAR
jgi:nitric oxide reductase subunit C